MTDRPETDAPRPAERSPFIEGYLDQRYREGFRPPSDYPPSRLPDTGGRVMEVVTSWFAGRPREAERCVNRA